MLALVGDITSKKDISGKHDTLAVPTPSIDGYIYVVTKYVYIYFDYGTGEGSLATLQWKADGEGVAIVNHVTLLCIMPVIACIGNKLPNHSTCRIHNEQRGSIASLE